MQVYGPFAFGIMSLLIIWFTIVKQQLEKQAVDYQQQQVIVDKLKELGINQTTTAATLERTAVILDGLVKEIREAHGK